MKSKKALFEDLQSIVGLDFTPSLTSAGISNETYGKQSMIYIDWGALRRRGKYAINRNLGERALEKLGYKVNKNYWPESEISEVQVTYFKGWHWDE